MTLDPFKESRPKTNSGPLAQVNIEDKTDLSSFVEK